MSVKDLRLKQCLSQEELADATGLSLRTVQRVESGQQVGNASWKTLADYFSVSVEALKANGSNAFAQTTTDRMAYHRAAQLIIFIVTFFVCVIQWLAFYSYRNPGPGDASLWTILTYVAEIALAAAIFAYLFNRARITFVWSYYATAAAFFVVAIAVDIWTGPYTDSPSYPLLFPAFYTLMLLALLLIHVLQMALSLKGESAVILQQ